MQPTCNRHHGDHGSGESPEHAVFSETEKAWKKTKQLGKVWKMEKWNIEKWKNLQKLEKWTTWKMEKWKKWNALETWNKLEIEVIWENGAHGKLKNGKTETFGKMEKMEN